MSKSSFFSLVVCVGLILNLTSNSILALQIRQEKVGGYITPKLHHETLTFDYYLDLVEFVCDSVKIQLSNKQKNQDGSFGWENKWFSLEPSLTEFNDSIFGRVWHGQLVVPGKRHEIPPKFKLRLYEKTTTASSDEALLIDKEYAFYPFGLGGGQGSFGVSNSSLSGFPAPINSSSNTLVLRAETQWGYCTKNTTLSLGYRINWSSRFSLLDYARLELKKNMWATSFWKPAIHGAMSFSRVKGKSETDEFIKKGVGVEAGLQFEGPFESFKYSYNSTAGGYHRIDVLLSILSKAGGQMKGGTMFSIYRGKYVKMIGISAFVSGWGTEDGLQYRNNRPFFHKALAWLAILPFIPIGLGGKG